MKILRGLPFVSHKTWSLILTSVEKGIDTSLELAIQRMSTRSYDRTFQDLLDVSERLFFKTQAQHSPADSGAIWARKRDVAGLRGS
jgi:hypothetical protein